MRNKLIERIKYWSQIFLLPIYGLSFLVPKNKKTGYLGVHSVIDSQKVQGIFTCILDNIKVKRFR